MIVGTLRLQLVVRDAVTLKDKRRALKSFKDRVRNKFNVSIAEVDAQDHRQRAILGVAMVANDRRYVEGALGQVVRAASTHRDMILMDQELEWL